MTKIMETFGMKEGEELEHPWLNRSVETAQKRVEARNYQVRRRTLEFDDVMNQQREVVYGYRNEVMDTDEPRKMIYEVLDEVVPKKVAEFFENDENEEPDTEGLLNWLNTTFPLGLTAERAGLGTRTLGENSAYLIDTIKKAYEQKAAIEEPTALKGLERYIILNAIDRLWQEHLYAMDGLREAVSLRAFGQKDPLIEYKNDGYAMFVELMDGIKGEVLNNLFRSTTNLQAFEKLLGSLPQNLVQQMMSGDIMLGGTAADQMDAEDAASDPEHEIVPAPKLEFRREKPVAGRNDPCPCGSGKKFKNCCGRTA